MFAAIYFGQIAFAALPYIAPEPPPPPPPPPPVTYSYSCRFAIGQVIGEATGTVTIQTVGAKNSTARILPSGQRGRLSGLSTLGNRGGPGNGSCP